MKIRNFSSTHKSEAAYLLDYLTPDVFGTEEEESLKEKVRQLPLSDQIIFLLVAEYGIKDAANQLDITPKYLRKLFKQIKRTLLYDLSDTII